jgi:hypothetical protein
MKIHFLGGLEGKMKTDLMNQLKAGAVKRGCQNSGK